MDIIAGIFKNKKVNYKKLTSYGFVKGNGNFHFSRSLSTDGFVINITVSSDGKISAEIIDCEMNEPYTLHLVEDAVGGFVGKIKAEYENILTDIAEKCFEPDIFKAEYSKKIIEHIFQRYGDKLEFLWEKFPDNAIVRRKDNQKWYAAILTISRKKLGFDSDEKVEILDLRMAPDKIEQNIDGIKILPGYHMNKKHWVTIMLDGSVDFQEICRMLEESYVIAGKK